MNPVPSLPVSLSEPYTVPLTGRLSVRLYQDCRPSCLETSALQKGLVLMLDGKELIEEGIGFGVPVVKYVDKTFFSSNAEVEVQKNSSGYTLKKIYWLDTVSVKKLGKTAYIDDAVYSYLRETFEAFYLKHKKLKPLFNKIMEIRQLARIKTEFLPVKPRGTITVKYRCQPSGISIYADFSNITLNRCLEVLFLNEQGSSTFQKYTDTNGKVLLGNKIGAWDIVTADQAGLQSPKGTLKFSLQKLEGTELFRGWERTRKRFSWAGLSYSVPPNAGVFCYSIEMAFRAQ